MSALGLKLSFFVILQAVYTSHLSRPDKKAALPRATLTTVALGSPAFLERIRSGSATFRPSLARGLALGTTT